MNYRSHRFIVGLLTLLSVGCGARGGGGTITSFDTGAEGDAAVLPGNDATIGMDRVAPIDNGIPPFDDGVMPVDTGKPPVDNGFPPEDLGQPVDVGFPPACGDARCNGAETCMTCPSDCGACAATCNDGTCNGAETCTTCPTDCGACPARCGDGSCNGAETCTTCASDCGACPARCGDGSCSAGETCTTCASDCGACPVSCGAAGTCGACASTPGCGWCTFDGACQAGNASGPSVTSTCSLFGGWVRNAASCAVDAGVRDVGFVDTGVSGNITRACGAGESSEGATVECGWATPVTYSCTPSATITVGCTGNADAGACAARVGSCAGDPLIRVCAGSSAQCSNGTRLASIATTGYAEDDACGTCPLARYTCPSSGSITVYWKRYYAATAASCTLGRL